MPAIEHAAELKEVGAGLVLAPNTLRLLRRLGVMDKLLDRAVALGSHAGRGGWDGPSYPSAGPERDVKLVSAGSVT